MIYTVTLNPAIDYVIEVEDFREGQINLTAKENIFFGGKGINVSTVLAHLGVDNSALGFVAGYMGDAMENACKTRGFNPDFLHLSSGMTRINVKLNTGVETEINGNGPEIQPKDLENLEQKLDQIKDGDVLVLAGSIPKSLPETTYERLIDRVKDKEVQVVVDARGELLLKVLPYHPFLVKPNHHELAEMFHVTLKDENDMVTYARKLQEMGGRNVLISMAGDGALLLGEDGKTYRRETPKGKVINSVGAGDSMVAGFLAGYHQSHGNLEEALAMGIAAGSASAFSKDLATGEQIKIQREGMNHDQR